MIFNFPNQPNNVKQQEVLTFVRNKGYNWYLRFTTESIRFEYWRQIPEDIFEGINKIIPVIEESWHDEDCGWKYFYLFLNPEEQRVETINYEIADLN